MKNENELPKRKQRLPLLLSTSLCDHTTGLQPTALTTSKSRWRALSDSLLETQSTKNRLDGLSSSEDLLKSPQLPPCPPSTSISSTLDPPLHSSSNETYTNVHKPPSLTFTEYIIEIFKPSQPFIHGAGQRSASVFNFFHVPLELEKTLWLGYFVCLDAFLDVLVILPLRLAYSIFVFFTQNRKFNIITDLWKELLFILAFWGLLQFDPSILYHDIRGQSLLKLYVVFNLLEVCDKLCSSFGLDVLDSLFSRPTTTLHHFTFSLHFSLALLYIVIHSLVFYYQMITLNVAINSHSSTLITLLISNQFVEIKSSVFKRFESENLFQLSCADMVERMNLSIFLVLTAIRNWIEQKSQSLKLELFIPVIAVFLCEILVDWLKHAFITKFNMLEPSVYRKFRSAVFTPSYPSARKLGFSPIPLTVLFVRMCLDIYLSWVIWGILFLSLLFLKLGLGYFLVLSSLQYENEKDKSNSLGHVDRYTLVKSRIP